MLLAIAICNLFVLTIANPFHKYPFVFLLDVGNEELQKTNTEQIRISVPGGSIALRYPAIGEGETIAHLRVSGIDFGTDLKATIIDGGPGSRYVVLVFTGNSGVPYDAVLTVQTISDDKVDLNTQNSKSDDSEENGFNNSAEDFSDKSDAFKISNEVYLEKNNAELKQSSSNMYSYIQNDVINNEENKFKYDNFDQEDNLRIKDYNEGEGEPDKIDISRVESHSSESEYDDGVEGVESSVAVIEKSLDDSDNSDDGKQVESQGNSEADDYNDDSVDYKEHDKVRNDEEEIEQRFNDEEAHYVVGKNKDSNNNDDVDDYDNEDSFVVAS